MPQRPVRRSGSGFEEGECAPGRAGAAEPEPVRLGSVPAAAGGAVQEREVGRPDGVAGPTGRHLQVSGAAGRFLPPPQTVNASSRPQTHEPHRGERPDAPVPEGDPGGEAPHTWTLPVPACPNLSPCPPRSGPSCRRRSTPTRLIIASWSVAAAACASPCAASGKAPPPCCSRSSLR